MKTESRIIATLVVGVLGLGGYELYRSGYEAGKRDGREKGIREAIPGSAQLRDINNDGVADIVVTLQNGLQRAFYNLPDGTYRDALDHLEYNLTKNHQSKK